MRRWILPLALLCSLSLPAQSVSVTVELSPSIRDQAASSGRLLLIFARDTSEEPRRRIDWPGPETPVVFGLDLNGWDGQQPVVVDGNMPMAGYKKSNLNALDTGAYFLQVLYDQDTLWSYPNADGNLYSVPVAVKVDEGGDAFTATLSRTIREEKPESTEFLKYFEFRSERLSAFWGRPMMLRAAALLPANFYSEPQRRYPVRYHFGGYHTRYTSLERRLKRDAAFRNWWFSDQGPQIVYVLLDGEGPYGDPYWVNSANNGPYGDALTQEFIPYLETEVRALGAPQSRFVDGGSTGGWVSLALQVFYPGFFNGVWSYCADAVDFHHFQLVDVYEDDNAFVNQSGYLRPSMRTTEGEPVFSIRDEVQLEAVLGRGNTFATGGGQWGAWNAVYSPRGRDGRPREIWNSATGAIDHRVAEAWKAYDLHQVLAGNWSEIGPQLQGKLHIWMGDMDSFYLNNAMRRLEEFLRSDLHPRSDARFFWGQGKGHCWLGISEQQLIGEMLDRFGEGK